MGVESCLDRNPDGVYLVINSDDFGLCHAVNEATVRSFEDGAITNSCFMPPCAWSSEVIRFMKRNPRFSVGIHLTLASSFDNCEIRPFLSPEVIPSLVNARGYFWSTTEQFQANADPEHARAEVEAQIDWVLRQGVTVSHLDDHMSTLTGYPGRNTDLHTVLYQAAEKYGLPVINYEKTAYNHPLDVFHEVIEVTDQPTNDKASWLVDRLRDLQPGLHVVICHLGLVSSELRHQSSYDNPWTEEYRVQDFGALHDARVHHAIRDLGIHLTNMREVAAAMRPGGKGR